MPWDGVAELEEEKRTAGSSGGDEWRVREEGIDGRRVYRMLSQCNAHVCIDTALRVSEEW